MLFGPGDIAGRFGWSALEIGDLELDELAFWHEQALAAADRDNGRLLNAIAGALKAGADGGGNP